MSKALPLFALCLSLAAAPVFAARSVLDPRPFAGGAWNDAFHNFIDFAATPAGGRIVGEDSPWRNVPAAMLRDDDPRGLAAVSPILHELSASVKAGEADGRTIGRGMIGVATLTEAEQQRLYEKLESWRKAAEARVSAEFELPQTLLTEYERRLDAGTALEENDEFELHMMRQAFSHPGFALYGAKARELAEGIRDRATRVQARWLTAKNGAPLQ